MKRFSLNKFLDIIRHCQITETALVTPIILALLGLPRDQKETALRSVRMVWCGGAPLSGRDQNALRDLCHPEALFSQVWGLTEMGWITTVHYPEKDESGSVGRLLPGNEARIISGRGDEVTDSCVKGEILLRGPSVMKGYLDNPEATNSMLVDGWLHTGDIGYESSGKWYIVDRAKVSSC